MAKSQTWQINHFIADIPMKSIAFPNKSNSNKTQLRLIRDLEKLASIRLLAGLLLVAIFFPPKIHSAKGEPANDWATPSTIRSNSSAIGLSAPKFPVRLKWVAEIIPGDSKKLQAIVMSEDGTYIDFVYHYDRKQKTRIPSEEIIEWGIRSDGSVGPGPMLPIALPLALILGAGEVQKYTIYLTFLDADAKPYSLIFDPYDNGKLFASLLRYTTGLEPSERRSDEYIELIKSRRKTRALSP